MSYNTKNYTEQGGEKTVIGGVLEIKEGASVKGLPVLENQGNSEATTIAALKENFNTLLANLKDTGYMIPDTWNISVSKIAQIPAGDNSEALTANQDKVSSVTVTNNVITIAVDVDELVEFPSSNVLQGTHKWIGIEITTGLSDITKIKYNGYQLTADDVAETAVCGGSAGDIIMWLKCDEIINTPKRFTLWSSGYAESEFSVVITEPAEE
jgi:hypothetical protein